MKTITLMLFHCSILVLARALKSPIRAPLSIITLNDITPSERRHIAYLEHKLERSKRSGSDSGAILNIIKTSIGNGIKKKIGQLTKASAAASGEFSRTSSSKGDEHYHYTNHVPHHHVEHEPSFDFWYLKKSVLNTLLQAVKAIKGGVIAIKGQLIKGGGKLVSASGKLVSSQGDAITKLGKTIATNAILVPYHSSSSNKGHYHEEYEVENHYTGPGPSHEDIYHNGPSGSSLDYHVSEDHPHHHDEGSGGLLILKKITDVNQGPQIHHRQSHYVQPPSAGNLFTKLFSASSSLDPRKPELYPDKFPPNDYTDEVYKEPSYNKDYEIASLDTHPQEIPSASTISKHRVRLSPNDQSKHHFNQDSNNLIMSSLKNQLKIVPQNSDSSLKGSETKNVVYNNNPDYNTKTNYVSEVTKPLSIYLETPKMNYLLPPINYDSQTTNYEQSALSDFNLNQILRANYENRFNNKTSNGQELVELSLTPSITYEIKEDGAQRIV